MASVAFLDDSFPFTGENLRASPLGGIQTATVMLAEALAARGHKVTIRGMVRGTEDCFGVRYAPLFDPSNKEEYDAVIANCAPKLFRWASGKKRILWLHGPARYMRKPRHAWPYMRYRPHLVFLGPYHETTWPRFLPRRHASTIPHAVGAPFTEAQPALAAPSPRAIFFSNPRRSLDWVLRIWGERIKPQLPEATLHIYAGRNNYGNRRDDKLDQALALVDSYAGQGVVLHPAVAKDDLVEALRESRVMLYRGDLGETYCFAAAEAQAMGVPLVTAGVGSLAERLIDGKTGFLAPDEEKFAACSCRLLKDEALWTAQHKAALDRRRSFTWADAAAMWEVQFLKGLEK